MRILVFGGTFFVSRAVAAEAVRRGHDVVCAARGTSGAVPDGARLVRIDRDEPDAFAGLAGERFDAVVDTSIMSHRWVADALDALAASTAHWTFVSSISVYADHETPGQRPGAPVAEPRPVHATLADRDADPDLYGAVKVASENAVRETFGERAFVVRPGLITGPGDHTDRFGYWPARFARGGRVVVPDVAQPVQYIDVRDLAAWIVTGAEERLGGTFDAVGPVAELGSLLADIAAEVGGGSGVGADTAAGPDAGAGSGVELVPVSAQRLADAGVAPWAGPRSLPLWVPSSHVGMVSHDDRPARDAGLRIRSLSDAVAGALSHERSLGIDRPRKAGLTPADEAEVLPQAPPDTAPENP